MLCRFVGCNLRTGREADRESAVCRFCDTDFLGIDGPDGGRFATADALARRIADTWGGERVACPLVVLTGGEPLLQVDVILIDALHAYGFEIAVETNGTLPAPAGIDWICVSPKNGAPLVQTRGHELKLVYPQAGAGPEQFVGLDFDDFLLQPMDGPERDGNTAKALRYCMAHPRWRLTLQTHKMLGIR